MFQTINDLPVKNCAALLYLFILFNIFVQWYVLLFNLSFSHDSCIFDIQIFVHENVIIKDNAPNLW